MKLNEIKDNQGSTQAAKRVGRGIGSGMGKTSTRGHKGQYSRNTVRPGFEGGQTPLYRRMPKRGFTNIHALVYEIINVGDIQGYIDSKKIDASKTIDAHYLRSVGLLSGSFDGLKLLGKGEIKSSVKFNVSIVSKKAKELVEKAGGSVETSKYIPVKKTAEKSENK